MTEKQIFDQRADFVIVTALPEEQDAVLSKLQGYRQLPPTQMDVHVYYECDLPVTLPNGSNGSYRIIVMCLPGMGRIEAASATVDAIQRWHPQYILMVGIAGGISNGKICLGDVLISDKIVDYELQKITPNGTEIRWDVHPADPRLLEASNNFKNNHWHQLIRTKRPEPGLPNRFKGPIASGDKVITFSEILTQYQEVWPKLVGVEMEAAGAAKAAFQSVDKPGFFMVRGVSDLADENKGKIDVEKWRLYACNVAAAFAIAFLQSGPVPFVKKSSGLIGIQERSLSTTLRVQVIIDGELSDFNTSRKEALIDMMGALLKTDPNNIQILRVQQGSIVITIEMPSEAANRFYQMARNRDSRIINLGIHSVKLEGREIINLTNNTSIHQNNNTQLLIEEQNISLGSALFQNIFGLLRTFLFFFILFYFASHYSSSFNGVVPSELTLKLQTPNSIFEYWPERLATAVACLTNGSFIRYMLAPLAAMLTVLLAGALYIKDVYALPGIKPALQYVVASMFTIGTPKLKIDKGEKQLNYGEINLLDVIGGPGPVLVEPGSAAIFRHLRAPSGSTISGARVLAPFEVISDTIDLAEQQCDKDEVSCITRDGLKINLRDIHFRYRIKTDGSKDTLILSGVPYPSETDLNKRIYSLSVTADGPEKWNAAVEGKIVGNMVEFISIHTLDYLTAPREGDLDPRQELLDHLYRSVPAALDGLGAELIWADFGHMEIVEEAVDDQRASQWAVDWIGDASLARAYGDAKRLAYQEMGRAEAQAEMIISIAECLRDANLGNNAPENLRKILLARTAQVLDSMGDMMKDAKGG